LFFSFFIFFIIKKNVLFLLYLFYHLFYFCLTCLLTEQGSLSQALTSEWLLLRDSHDLIMAVGFALRAFFLATGGGLSMAN
jgi:hypothetical protein